MKVHPVLRERVVPAMAATGVAALLATAGWYGYGAVVSHPVRNVVFAGDVDRLPRDILDEFSRELRKRTVGTSLASVRENAKRIPGVRDAAVRRQFPDTIEVTFEAYRPLARWNDRDLVSTHGEIFSAPRDASLPMFRGPDGFAPAMVAAWPRLAESLAPVGTPIAEVHVSARGAWDVLLASGLRIVLGREDMVARAQRFAAAWPQLAARGVDTRYADLRYPNGFALRQAAPVTTPKKNK
ncbi:MAG TPA: cell division protein FtsQ/DivIB [Usitatibacter sp.]|nr:cell division protein FtsQ/DivIB [Usitatibacter sp.]